MESCHRNSLTVTPVTPGHPKGLHACFLTEMWERFCFYGMKVLLLYLTKYHLFSDADGYDLLGADAALVYAMPVLGGLIAQPRSAAAENPAAVSRHLSV